MISHESKIIFVHINKCAGTTIDNALNQMFKMEGHHKHLMLAINGDYYQTNYREKANAKGKGQGFENYFKFTFVRNPWDKIVSNYFYQQKMNGKVKGISFKQWLRGSHPKPCLDNNMGRYEQLDWISDKDNKLLIDFVGRFENLQNDFNIICDKIGAPRKILPHTNKTKHLHYTHYYDDDSRKYVEKRFARDIAHFGYHYGQ